VPLFSQTLRAWVSFAIVAMDPHHGRREGYCIAASCAATVLPGRASVLALVVLVAAALPLLTTGVQPSAPAHAVVDDALDTTNGDFAGVATPAVAVEMSGTITAAEAEPLELGALGNETDSFDYHKDLFPMDLVHDGLTIGLASIGLMIAASGGIGGGGMLVPLFMLVLGFKTKHAIALSNCTILGGSIANTAVNSRKRHPGLDRPLIDWDLVLIMEPFTIFGAVFGALMGKILPDIVLTVSLVLILALMGQHSIQMGLKMWNEETAKMTVQLADQDGVYYEFGSNNEAPVSFDVRRGPVREASLFCKISSLTACFAGVCVLTMLKGGGSLPSPFGFDCGSLGYWALYFGNIPWVLIFALSFRAVLVGEFQAKLRSGHTFVAGEMKWDSCNTIKYPIFCSAAGLMAGLFGVGGGIVKGPLMLEMGIAPSVASASAAAMILFTSAAASTSFVVFGLLQVGYGCLFFVVGLVSTIIGQYGVGRLLEKRGRQSPIVLSIGLVICISSLMAFVQDAVAIASGGAAELFRAHGVCSSAA